MGLLSWLILGGLSGWIASKIMKKDASMGIIANIITGIAGAFIGGIVFNIIGGRSVTGLNLHSLIVSVVGACILLWAINKMKK